MEYHPAIKKNEIMTFSATWMDLESIILIEVSQKWKDKTIWYQLYVESKYYTNEPIYETEIDLTNIENRLVAKGEEVGGDIEWEVRINRCKLLYIE